MVEPLWATLTAYPLVVLAVSVMVEGPLATIVAGTLVGAGLLGWWPVWAIAVTADVLADCCLYALGRHGTRPRVARLLDRWGLGPSRRAELRDRVTTHLPAAVVGAKVVDIGAVPVFLAAGLARVPFGRFLTWVTGATLVRAGVLIGLGALLGTQLTTELAERPWIVLVAGVGVLTVLTVARLLVRRRRVGRKALCAS